MIILYGEKSIEIIWNPILFSCGDAENSVIHIHIKSIKKDEVPGEETFEESRDSRGDKVCKWIDYTNDSFGLSWKLFFESLVHWGLRSFVSEASKIKYWEQIAAL